VKFAVRVERPKHGIPRLTELVGLALAQVEEQTQVFSFAELRNIMRREGFWLDGLAASSEK
jgi:hypothetical protein